MPEIRRFDASDLEDLSRLHQEIFGEKHELEFFLKEDAYVVLGETGKSFLIVKHILDEGEIIYIGVSKEYRKQGLATKLLEKYLALYHPDELFLDVREDNLAAIGLYKKFRFEELYKRKAYYQDGVDAIVMRREKDENVGN